MQTLELNKMGLQEMNIGEQNETEGGVPFLVGFVIGAAVTGGGAALVCAGLTLLF